MIKQKSEATSAGARARGKRLKTVRLMAQLTRLALETKHGISSSTLQSWESAKSSGLTERGVQRILPALEKEGVYCTSDWLLYGVGAAPQIIGVNGNELADKTNLPIVALNENRAVIEEVLYFRSIHRDALDMMVADDGMEPHYHLNDHVAGKCRTGTRIDYLVGMDCIVQTKQNQLLFRRLLKSTQAHRYNLICTNINTTARSPILYDQEIIGAAPIIWHRRRDKYTPPR